MAFLGGMPFLAIYLLYLLARTGGDLRRVQDFYRGADLRGVIASSTL